MSASVANNSEINSENNIQNGNSELAQMVKESTATIGAQQMAQPKRKVGRPRKNPEPTAPQNPTPSVESHEIVPPPEIAEFLVPPLMAVSSIPAAKHNIPELALSEGEAKACADSLQHVLNAFVPDLGKMSPKAAAVLGAALTFGSIGISKMQIYAQKKEELIRKARESQNINNDLPPPPEHIGPKAPTPPNFAQNSPFGP